MIYKKNPIPGTAGAVGTVIKTRNHQFPRSVGVWISLPAGQAGSALALASALISSAFASASASF